METITEVLKKYAGGRPTVYYEQMLAHAVEVINWQRQLHPEREICFVCGPLSGRSPVEEAANFFSMAYTMGNLNVFSRFVCINTLYYNARLNPDDPREFGLKFEIFYNGLIDISQRMFVKPDYVGVRGCETEINYAKAIGKPIHLLTLNVPGPTPIEASYIGDPGFHSVSTLPWVRPTERLIFSWEELLPLEEIAAPFPR